MMFRTLAVLVFSSLLVVGGCSKKEEQAPEVKVPSPTVEVPAQRLPEAKPTPTTRRVVVPDEIKAVWKSVVFEVTDKATGTARDVTVEVGGTGTVGDLVIEVQTFLPSFSMGGGTITSKSVETENPAAQLVVKENGSVVFTGWLFSLYPEAHPFEHDKYGLILKDFIKNP